MKQNRVAKITPGVLFLFLCTLGTGAFAAGGNYSDRIDFGNAVSESAHGFNAGYGGRPPGGVGALGQTFRAPVGGGPGAGRNTLAFNLAVSPTRQNYLTVRMWGNDKTTMRLWLQGADASYLSGTETAGGETSLNLASLDANNVDGGEAAPFPNRFYYDTGPIPYAMTFGRTNVTLVLYEDTTANTRLPAGPVYSAYSHTDPHFVPDGNDPAGTPLPLLGQSNLVSLTLSQVTAWLQTNRLNLYGSGGYFTNLLQRQILPDMADNPPPEVIGLDLLNPVSAWTNANPKASPDTWRNAVACLTMGPGYTVCPDELLSVLISTFTLPPFTNASGSVVPGLDHYHDTNLLPRIFYALDGSTYLQDSDGGYVAQGGGISASQYGYWTGICSSPRTNGPWLGITNREPTTWGGGSLEGVDSFTVGWTMVQLLNDPVAYPVFTNWLAQSYNVDFTGTNMLRAYAYERMLYNHIGYAQNNTGGTESQNCFQELGGYAAWVALGKLQQIYTNASYVPTHSQINYMKMVMGLYPDTLRGPNVSSTTDTNYGMDAAGFGEAEGVLSCSYDGRYGSMLPWLAPWFARLAALDPAMDPATLANVQVQARAAISGFDQFISPGENYQGINNYFTLAQEDYITYRKPYNPNANGNNFFVNSTYSSSDPALGIHSPFALRSAYLEALYGKIPSVYETVYSWGGGYNAASRTDYLKTLASYEATLRSLVGVNPADLTPLPGEPGQPNHAFVDVQSGVTAIYYNGERFFASPNWRNYLATNRVSVSGLARIHDTTATEDIAALVLMPGNNATVQSDGNLSGGPRQPWVVRFGQWLIAGNPTAGSSALQLPSGSGMAVDLVSSNQYRLGSTLSLAANQAVAIYLPLVTTAQPIADGTYVVSNLWSRRVMDNPGSSTRAGTQMDQAVGTGGQNQEWVFTCNGSGYYTISNVAGGLWLDNPAGSTNSSLALDQQPAAGSDNQLWQLIPSGSGYYLKNKFSGLLADIAGSATNSGALLDMESDSAAASQAWQLVPVTASAAALQPVPNGTYALICAVSGLALASTNTSANSQMAQALPGGGDNQKWVFTGSGGGGYTIKNVNSGYYLTDPGGSAVSGARLQQQALLTGGSTNNQLWQLIPAGTGFTLVNQAGGLVIDDPGSAVTPGVGIDLWSWNGGMNQVWLLAGPPGVPTGLGAAAGYGHVQLSWTAGTNYPMGYNVKRSTTNGGPYTVIAAGVTDTTFVDAGVIAGTNYYYVVSSTNGFGESDNSSPIGATVSGTLVVWRGGVSTHWDMATTANWMQAGAASVYQDGSAVWFDDTASSNTVNLTASVAPGCVTFNNSALDYTLTSFGGAGMNGTNALVKGGTGTLALAGTNTFSGGITIQNGTLRSDNTNALGTGALTLGDGVSANNATLQASPGVSFGNNNPLIIAGGGGVYTLLDSNTRDYQLTGGIALNHALTCRTTSDGALFLYGVITSGSENPDLTVDGGGTTTKFVGLYGNNASTFTGNVIVVNQGDLKSGNPGSLSAANTVSLDRTATLDNGSMNLTVAGLNDYAGGGGTVANAGSGKILTLAGSGSYSFSGVINNVGGILKTNTGTQILSGANTGSGPVTVSQGRLVISTLHLGQNNFTVTNGAALCVTNRENAQAAGISRLTLGAAVPTTLEFQNVADPATALMVAGDIMVRGACVIQVTGTNRLASGSLYPLVNYSGLLTGTYGNLALQMPSGWAGVLVSNAHQIAVSVVSLPAAPSGLSATAGNAQAILTWTASAAATGYNLKGSITNGGAYALIAGNYGATSYTHLGLANGTTYYYVVSATNAAGESANSPPVSVRPISSASTPINFSVSQGWLQIGWPADHTGWLLQTQTNQLDAGLGTHWTTVPGSDSGTLYTTPINSVNESVFFRLIHP